MKLGTTVLWGFFISFGFLVVGMTAEAATVVRTGDSITLTAEQSVEGDFYGVGKNVAVSGTITDDLIGIAGSLTHNGDVAGDALILAGTVNVEGTVTDDVRIVAGSVTIGGEVNGSLVVVASELTVLSTAVINGDVLFFGGLAEIGGSVQGSIYGSSERLRVDAPINGNIDVTTGQLLLGDRASVSGNVSYMSYLELVRAQNADVKGKITQNTMSDETTPAPWRTPLMVGLIWLFSALVLHLFARRFNEEIPSLIAARALRLGGIGLLFLIAIPFVAALLVASTIGIVFAVVLLLTSLVLIIVAWMLIPLVIGHVVSVALKRSHSIPVKILLGVVIGTTLLFVPFVGGGIFLAFLIVTVGALLESLYRYLRG